MNNANNNRHNRRAAAKIAAAKAETIAPVVLSRAEIRLNADKARAFAGEKPAYPDFSANTHQPYKATRNDPKRGWQYEFDLAAIALQIDGTDRKAANAVIKDLAAFKVTGGTPNYTTTPKAMDRFRHLLIAYVQGRLAAAATVARDAAKAAKAAAKANGNGNGSNGSNESGDAPADTVQESGDSPADVQESGDAPADTIESNGNSAESNDSTE